MWHLKKNKQKFKLYNDYYYIKELFASNICNTNTFIHNTHSYTHIIIIWQFFSVILFTNKQTNKNNLIVFLVQIHFFSSFKKLSSSNVIKQKLTTDPCVILLFVVYLKSKTHKISIYSLNELFFWTHGFETEFFFFFWLLELFVFFICFRIESNKKK